MTTKGLGKDFDICPAVVPVADTEAALTGLRLNMKNYGGVAIVTYLGAASAGTDAYAPNVKQHDAASAGNTKDLATVTEYYLKSEATLDNDETWTRTTQAAGATIALGTSLAGLQLIAVIQVDADELDTANGYQWLSVTLADPGSGGTRPGCFFYIPYGLKQQRAPQNLPNAQT